MYETIYEKECSWKKGSPQYLSYLHSVGSLNVYCGFTIPFFLLQHHFLLKKFLQFLGNCYFSPTNNLCTSSRLKEQEIMHVYIASHMSNTFVFLLLSPTWQLRARKHFVCMQGREKGRT